MKREKEPKFYKFVFDGGDNGVNESNVSDGTTPPNSNLPDVGRVNMMSRDEQLKALANKHFQELCPPEITLLSKKITLEQEETFIKKMQIDIEKRKVHDTQLKSRIEADLARGIRKPHTNNRSNTIVDDTRRRALSEIFNVLLISVEYTRSQEKSPGKGVGGGGDESSTDASTRGLLDTSLADPTMLKPKNLADAIAGVLEDYKPGCISREVFIAAVTDLMAKGKSAPLNSLLSAPNTSSSRVRSSNSYKSPAERLAAKEKLNRGQLIMPARSVNDRYLVGRDKYLKENDIAHHDMIYAYDHIYRQKLEENREMMRRKEKTRCTFQPKLSTRSSSREYWSQRASERLNNFDNGAKENKSEESNRTNRENLKFWRDSSGEKQEQASSISGSVSDSMSVKSFDDATSHLGVSKLSASSSTQHTPKHSYSYQYEVKVSRNLNRSVGEE